jgi:transcriptional repressor NrdR
MRCPFCSATEDKVVDTRPSDNEQIIRRRRECVGCSRRFTTYERIEEVLPLVIKKDGRREPYDRAKLMAGLKKACEKRPVPIETLEKTLDEIERSLQELGEKEVASTRIGDAVLAKLREIDEVAYVRFASVYLSFRDAGELMNEVQRLIRSKGESQ